MKKPLIILSAVLCMVLPSLSPAEMRQQEPRQLAAAWQEVKKQMADDGKTIRVRDGIQALELLAELGISSRSGGRRQGCPRQSDHCGHAWEERGRDFLRAGC